MSGYFLGMISGTSVDGVDAVICRFDAHRCELAAARTFAYPPAIQQRIQSLIETGQGSLADIGSIDIAVGRYFADCAIALIREAGLKTDDIAAIGHHGQTIWHQPDPPEPFSWQIGDPNSIAAITGIDTIADLRRLDMAVGGQGAPLVPAFHQWLFADASRPRVILNIGGIANITVLAPGRPLAGFDTGPGNTLLDAWTRRCLGTPYDEGGQWSATGTVDAALLELLLDDPYFGLEPPKSTGRERFNAAWLRSRLERLPETPADVDIAATLLELTARSITGTIAALDLEEPELIVCGGGAWNETLMKRLGELGGRQAATTADFGLDPDWVEAAAMAWLARARLETRAGNRPTVTAAREGRVLGGLYSGAVPQPD